MRIERGAKINIRSCEAEITTFTTGRGLMPNQEHITRSVIRISKAWNGYGTYCCNESVPDLEVTSFCYNQEHSGKTIKTTVIH